MNTHHVFSLCCHQSFLNVPPGDRVQVAVFYLEGRVVEALDVPELEHVVHHDDRSRDPEDNTDEYEHFGHEGHVAETVADDNVLYVRSIREGKVYIFSFSH